MEQVIEWVEGLPFHLIVISFSVIGVILIGSAAEYILSGKIGDLKHHRSSAPGVADLLNWSSVIDDGIILCKNGALMASWLYRGADNASATNADRNVVSRQVNAALNQMGSGWMLHIDAIRRPCPSYSHPSFSHFPDPVSQAIDDERRAFFTHLGTLYEGCFVITATYFPPPLVQAKFVEIMYDDPNEGSTKFSERGEKILQDFRRDINSFENRLSTVLTLERLRSYTITDEYGTTVTHDDFLRWLHFCLTGNNQPICLPESPTHIDCLIGGQDMTGGIVPVIGNKYVMVVGIDNFPFESHPGILARLAELPVEYRWSTRFIFLDSHESISLINKYKRQWKQKIRGIKDQLFRTNSGSIDHDAKSMFDDCEMALMEVNSGVVAMGLYTSCVVMMHEDMDVLRDSANYIQKVLGAIGFPARIEDVNTMDSFFGTLPGHGVENVRRAMMNTRHLADMMPTSSIWTGHDQAPCNLYPPLSPALMYCVTTGSSPFRLNLHVADLGHTLILGRTGGGKSTILGAITGQFLRYPNMTIYAIDKGQSLYTLCKAVGGDHYNIAGSSQKDKSHLSFCPLQWLESSPAEKAWALSWIETLISLNGVIITPKQRNEISKRLEVFGKSGERTLLSFMTGLQDEQMRAALEMYTRAGMYGYLLDADEDGLDLKEEGGLTVFELEELMAIAEPKIVLPVLLYLFHRIERSLHGQPAAILLDEAWLFLAHPVFSSKIREWLKVMRKNNCAVIMATQSLSDVMNSDIVDVIKDSTATKIYLPNPHAKGADTAALYHRMGLNTRQVEIIASAIPKRHYYYVSEEGNRLFELALGKLQLALVAVSDKESLAQVKELEDQYGKEWVAEWLSIRGVDAATVSRIREGVAV